jgi:phage protein D
MAAKRNRRKNVTSTTERLLAAAAEARKQASLLRPGIERQNLLRKAREAEAAVHMNEWLTSPGLQPPK